LSVEENGCVGERQYEEERISLVLLQFEKVKKVKCLHQEASHQVWLWTTKNDGRNLALALVSKPNGVRSEHEAPVYGSIFAWRF